MTQVKTDILLNGRRLEIHPCKLTKCGEIQINDDCTSVFLFCAFCSVDDRDLKFFKSLAEFIDHIRWHRSDDLHSPQSPASPKSTAAKTLFEKEDSTTNLSAPRHETDDINDWIAPPDELFELNTISNFIQMDHGDHDCKSSEILDNVDENMHQNSLATGITKVAKEEESPEITGEVFIELLDLFKKCPCVWHVQTAAETSLTTIEGVYKLLTLHYNRCAQKTASLDYVRGIVTQIKDCFLEEYKDLEYSMNGSLDCLPWYFPYLSFLLDNDSKELDKSVFTDFLCPICVKELKCQDDLWKHLVKVHLEPIEDGLKNRKKHISWDHYPREIVEKFIQVYKSQTRLWDKSNDEYYSRPLRRRSYEILLKILRRQDPEATNSDVVCKINNLRTQFAYDRRKILFSKDTTLLSHSWLYDKLKFLVGNYTKRAKKKPSPRIKARPANFKKKVKNAKCPICTKSFSDHSAWLSHMQCAHTSNEYLSEDGFFYCTICGWQSKTKELLMRHLRNQHTHNLQKCTDCNLAFRLLSMLVEHRAKVHNDYLPFKCETCGDGFATRSRLRKHSMIHWSAQDLPHKCEHCGDNFSEKKAYNVHIRQHKTEKKFLCEICEKNMTSLADLRKHTRTHLNEYRHVCDSCGKAFLSSSLLTTHLNEVHGGVTFQCTKCEKEFRTEEALADHFEGHQNLYSCEICESNFFRKASLRKHKRLKHGYA